MFIVTKCLPNQKFKYSSSNLTVMGFALDGQSTLKTCYLCWLSPPGAHWSPRNQQLSWPGHGKRRKSEGSDLWYPCSWQLCAQSDSFAHSDPTLREDEIEEDGKANPPHILGTILKEPRQSCQKLKEHGDG